MTGPLRALFSLAFTVAVLVAGCTAELPDVPAMISGQRIPAVPSVTLHADTAFTPTERGLITTASALWSVQTSGLAKIQVVYDLDFDSVSSITEHATNGHNMMKRMTSDMPEVQGEDEPNAKLLGEVMPSGGVHNPWHLPLRVIFVADRLEGDPQFYLQVILHEFGHVLGLPHSPVISAIMYPSAIREKTACLKVNDLASFCNVNVCGTHRMIPCE